MARPHLDWRAFVIAAAVGGVTALIAAIALSAAALGEPSLVLRMTASLALGPDVIPVTAGKPAGILLIGLLIHLVLTFVYAFLVVLVVHRWGLVVGLVGGALVGLALYAINVYALSYIFPWIYPLRSWMLLLTHVILGAFVGVVYELLDKYDLPFPVTNT
jgi:hypothetical protein